MASITVAGPAGSLHVDDGGTGSIPVLFLHSLAGDTSHWAFQVEHLRRKGRAIAVDLRGHGLSEMPKDLDELTVDRLAADVAAVANALGLYHFVLVGHSMGGAVAISYAQSFSHRVAGLLLVDAPGKLPDGEAPKIMAAVEKDLGIMRKYWEAQLAGARPEVREKILAGLKRMPKAAGIELTRSVFGYDPVPPLILYPGLRLALITDHNHQQPTDLHRVVPGLPWKRIHDTSHWPHLDKPATFNAILDVYLDAVPSADEEFYRRAG